MRNQTGCERHRHLQQWVSNRLRAEIFDGRHRPGDWLRQESAARDEGVAVGPPCSTRPNDSGRNGVDSAAWLRREFQGVFSGGSWSARSVVEEVRRARVVPHRLPDRVAHRSRREAEDRGPTGRKGEVRKVKRSHLVALAILVVFLLGTFTALSQALPSATLSGKVAADGTVTATAITVRG